MDVKQGYKGNSKKLVSSELLYEQLKAYDDRRESKQHKALYHKETITVVDTPAYYNLATSTDSGALNVVLTVTDNTTQIALTDINTQTTPVDLSALTGDGSEYVVLVPETNHEEEVEKETYRKANDSYTKDEVDSKILQASTGLKMYTEPEYTTFMDNLVVTSSKYVDPSQP